MNAGNDFWYPPNERRLNGMTAPSQGEHNGEVDELVYQLVDD